jgi:tetratricopeptide (TPR) repeat protein
LLQALRDKDSQVRYRSVRALSSFPYEQWKDAVSTLFSDKVKAVRIAAADVLLQVPVEQISADHRNAFATARKELEQYVMYQADFAVGNVLIGDFYYRLNDQMNAEKFYRRGLKKDSLMNYVRFNLSSLYNTQGRNAEALKLLEEARVTDGSNPRVYYNMALLQVEMKDMTGALKNFEKAIDKGADDPRIFYNYGLLKQQNGNPAAAEKLLIKGLGIAPQDPALNYALAVFYMQQQQPRKAMGPASVLKRTDPGNPDYQQLFNQLQMN